MNKKAYLILENGTVFVGDSFGACQETTGELVFTTGMVGYLETLTDPSYFGQLVVQTFPLIGNYGVIPSDLESSAPALKAYIVREWCQEPSNFRCEGILDTFLKDNGVVGICGIDTRYLTKVIRDQGVMNAKIVFEEPANVDAVVNELKGYSIENAVSAVTTDKVRVAEAEDKKYTVALLDLGTNSFIEKELNKLGCEVYVMPASSTAKDIADVKPDGIVISNGPGNPKDNAQIIDEVKKMAELNIPMFGIGLGHQILALSQGADTVKLHYGHRGASQPVLDKAAGVVVTTSQNHGYAVDIDSISENIEVTYTNVNDSTCEGLSYKNIKAFSTQFYPEGVSELNPGKSLYERFVNMIKEGK